jgi:hypothetical protein
MFRFELSEPMTMVIVNALSNQPFREVAQVITELQRQINSQMQTRQANGREANIEAP